MTDEKSILEQFAAGNHTAFRELFMRYHLKSIISCWDS